MRSEPEMPLRRRRVDQRASLIHRDLGWTEGIQPLPPSRQPTPPRRPRFALTTQHNTKHAAGSHVHRRLSRRRRHPHVARQLRSQAPPCRPQPHGSRSAGLSRPKAQADPDYMATATWASPPAGILPHPLSPRRAYRRGRDTAPPQSCEEDRRHRRREERR
jgi:hypothetical protein